MDLNDKVIARKLFRLKIYESDGQSYEDLFTSVIKSKYPDFTPIEPSGNVGDRKNDGYRPMFGHYYQVHAPKELSHSTRKAAAKKAREDFKGLNGFWGKYTAIREYHFVCNDKYKGSLVEVETELLQLKSDYSLDNTSSFLSKNLEDMLFDLSDDLIVDHIGLIPQAPNFSLDFSVLGEVIGHIHKEGSPIIFTNDFSTLDFGEKIQFNKLSSVVQTLLEKASFHIRDIDNYFQGNSNFAKQRLRDEIKTLYQKSVEDLKQANDDNNVSDLIFFDILNAMIPSHISDGEKRHLQEAALVVMAYYFEACDLFEHPETVS